MRIGKVCHFPGRAGRRGPVVGCSVSRFLRRGHGRLSGRGAGAASVVERDCFT